MQQENVTAGTFISRLEPLLSERGWTKTELARQVGVTHPAVLKWWKGQVPKAETLMRLASILGVRPDWLASGLGPDKDFTKAVQEASRKAEEMAGEVDTKQVIFDLEMERRRTTELEAQNAELRKQLEKLQSNIEKALAEAGATLQKITP